MKILMSIKPKYVDKILRETKQWEFRRRIWKDWEKSKLLGIYRIAVYASAPISKIVFEFEIEAIYQTVPETIWEYCNNNSGMSEKEFFKYFNGADVGYAILIGKIWHYTEPVRLSDYGLKRPPQNFMYLPELCSLKD
jgi:predicted transcriptional regulator